MEGIGFNQIAARALLDPKGARVDLDLPQRRKDGGHV